MLVTCPHCTKKTHPGACCEKCGGALPAAAVAAADAEAKVERADASAAPETEAARPPLDETPTHAAGVPPPERDGASERDRAPERPWLGGDWKKLDEKIAFETRERPETKRPETRKTAPGRVVFYVDRLCVLVEGAPGFVRFQLDPPAGEVLENVALHLRDISTGLDCSAYAEFVGDESDVLEQWRRQGNLRVGFPKLQAGSYAFDVELTYMAYGMRQRATTSVGVAVMRRENASALADKLVFNIVNDIKAEGAADVHVSNRIADEVRGCLKQGEDPFDLLLRMANGRDRAWSCLPLQQRYAILPPVPAKAQTDAVTLDFGDHVLHLFAKRTLSFGRNRACDVTMRPVDSASELEKAQFLKMSRRHCTFEHAGKQVKIFDGSRNGRGIVQFSTLGTYWKNEKLDEALLLDAGVRGVLSFGGESSKSVVSVDVKTLVHRAACADCPFADKRWCGEGRPSLLLTRRDKLPEQFAALWSCLDLADVDPSYAGVVVFRKNRAFAWMRKDACGWLVPGDVVETEYGEVKVSKLEKEQEKEK